MPARSARRKTIRPSYAHSRPTLQLELIYVRTWLQGVQEKTNSAELCSLPHAPHSTLHRYIVECPVVRLSAQADTCNLVFNALLKHTPAIAAYNQTAQQERLLQIDSTTSQIQVQLLVAVDFDHCGHPVAGTAFMEPQITLFPSNLHLVQVPVHPCRLRKAPIAKERLNLGERSKGRNGVVRVWSILRPHD